VCTDELLAELGGEVAATLAGEPNGEAVLSIHVATDAQVAAAIQEAAEAGGAVVKPPTTTPLGGSYTFSPTRTGTSWRSSTIRSASSGPTGGPRSPRPAPAWRSTGLWGQ
jgi:uncharacterized glyoxalase superfamily protein PhnB